MVDIQQFQQGLHARGLAFIVDNEVLYSIDILVLVIFQANRKLVPGGQSGTRQSEH